MKRFGKMVAVLIALLLIAFVIFRTPDTDSAEMRVKYGGAPSEFVDLGDSLTVHLRDEGPEDAPVIMLLHGSNADLHTWQPWVEALTSEDSATPYRVIRFDQIGHGLTGPAPDGSYEMTAFVETVNKVADKLAIDSFVLGGNSMGGGIAMAYALEHPQRLRGLVLVDASGAPVKREGEGAGNIGFTILRTPGIRNLMTQITPRSMVEKSLSQSVSNQAVVTPEAVDRYWELLRYPGNRAATLERFATPRTSFSAQEAQSMKVPTLVMWGQEDALIPFAAAAWFTANIPDAVEVSYPAIGHLPMEEVPQQSAKELMDWLANLPLATANPA